MIVRYENANELEPEIWAILPSTGGHCVISHFLETTKNAAIKTFLSFFSFRFFLPFFFFLSFSFFLNKDICEEAHFL